MMEYNDGEWTRRKKNPLEAAAETVGERIGSNTVRMPEAAAGLETTAELLAGMEPVAIVRFGREMAREVTEEGQMQDADRIADLEEDFRTGGAEGIYTGRDFSVGGRTSDYATTDGFNRENMRGFGSGGRTGRRDGTQGLSRREVEDVVENRLASLRVYVLESDITQAQNAVKSAVEMATF